MSADHSGHQPTEPTGGNDCKGSPRGEAYTQVAFVRIGDMVDHDDTGSHQSNE